MPGRLLDHVKQREAEREVHVLTASGVVEVGIRDRTPGARALLDIVGNDPSHRVARLDPEVAVQVVSVDGETAAAKAWVSVRPATLLTTVAR